MMENQLDYLNMGSWERSLQENAMQPVIACPKLLDIVKKQIGQYQAYRSVNTSANCWE